MRDLQNQALGGSADELPRVSRFRRLPASTRARLLKAGSSTLYEAAGGLGGLSATIRPVWKGAAVCGRAFTVRCANGDNLAIHRALLGCGPGDVLSVAVQGHLAGYFGEVLAVAAQVRGVDGLVIDGGVRDVERLEELRFPAFAAGIGMFRTVKHESGHLQIPVALAGVVVSPGDVVVGDADGVCVLPSDFVGHVLREGEKRVRQEATMIEEIRKGRSTLDILDLPRPLSGPNQG